MRKNPLAVLAVMMALVTILCACGSQPSVEHEPTWQEQYDLGVRYLSEGNYQEAVIAFTAAIEIDPKQSFAYVGRGDAYVIAAQALSNGIVDPDQMGEDALAAYQNAAQDYLTAIKLDKETPSIYRKTAEVYLALGDADAAAEILEKGFRTTEDEDLQILFDELSGVFALEEIPRDSSEYAALEEFLSLFGWHWHDYDCETATERVAASEWTLPRNTLEDLLTVASCYCYDSTLYPGEAMKDFWFESDPLGKWDAFMRVNSDSLEWTLRHIFNCSQADIETMKKPVLAGEDESIYYLDGYYYFQLGGIGGGYQATITNIERSGLRYRVEYDLQDMYEEEPTPYCALVSLKEIDGKSYWSLYRKQMAGRPCGDDLTWTLQAGKLTISGTGPMMDFNPYDFSDEPAPPWVGSYITSVEIKDGVTSIGSYAFWGCEYLTSVQIPDSMTSIGNNAFWACSRLEEISIPNSVTTIGEFAFQACGFKTFTVPSGVSSVSRGMLMECGSLTSVTITEGVTRIEEAAFTECTSLKSLIIPGSISFIDTGAFYRCIDLSDIYFAGNRNEWVGGQPDYTTVHYNSAGR